jgi:hypothetical protein
VNQIPQCEHLPSQQGTICKALKSRWQKQEHSIIELELFDRHTGAIFFDPSFFFMTTSECGRGRSIGATAVKIFNYLNKSSTRLPGFKNLQSRQNRQKCLVFE